MLTQDCYVTREIFPGVWDIGDKRGGVTPGVDAYLVLGENKALLLDGGQSVEDLRGAVEKITDLPVEALVLHGHNDHTGNIQQFETVYMSPLDKPIFSVLEAEGFDPERTLPLEDGMSFDLGGRRLEVMAAPGHTPGSMVVLDRENALLFSSDSVGSGFVWMQLPFCSALSAYGEMCAALYEKVKDIPGLTLITGHANQHAMPLYADYIAGQARLARMIVTGAIQTQPMENYDKLPEYCRGYQAFLPDTLCGICYNPRNL